LEGILLVLLFIALLVLIFFDVVIMPNYSKNHYPKNMTKREINFLGDDICMIDKNPCIKDNCDMMGRRSVDCGYRMGNHRKVMTKWNIGET